MPLFTSTGSAAVSHTSTGEYRGGAIWLPHVVAAVAVVVTVGACGRLGGGGAELPALPDLEGRMPAVAAHVRAACAGAARQPRSAAAVGALCGAYQADLFFSDAARCYDALAAIDDDWRWRYARALIDIELGGDERLADRLRAIAAAAPDFAPVWLRLGDAEFKAARYEAAAEAWRRAATLPPPVATSADGPPHVAEVPLSA